MKVRVVVDADRCIGSGVCEMLEETVFAIDEDTYIAATIGAAELATDRAAVVIDRCPASAIAIADTEGFSDAGEEE